MGQGEQDESQTKPNKGKGHDPAELFRALVTGHQQGAHHGASAGRTHQQTHAVWPAV